MLKHKAILFYFSTTLLNSCLSSAQISSIKILEDNQQKKYTLIKTNVFKSEATILKDTTNEFNQFTTQDAVKQYILSVFDVQEYESILKNGSISNNEIANNSDIDSENIVRHFENFKRQYSGYVNSSGDTLLVVCFIDFTNRKKAKEFFYRWKYQQIYLSSALYLDRKPPSMYCYAFNKRTKQLSRYKI